LHRTLVLLLLMLLMLLLLLLPMQTVLKAASLKPEGGAQELLVETVKWEHINTAK
jgi:hypothetical protein